MLPVSAASELGVELALPTAVNSAYHVAEVAHAHIESTGIAEQAIIELSLVPLRVVGSVANRLTILLFSVAAPHRINRLLARKEVVRASLEHLHLADIDTDLVVLAVAVTVAKETNLSSFRSDSLHINTKLVLGALLALPIDRILHHLVVKGWPVMGTSCTKPAHCFISLINQLN